MAIEFDVVLPDRPGELGRLTAALAEKSVNIDAIAAHTAFGKGYVAVLPAELMPATWQALRNTRPPMLNPSTSSSSICIGQEAASLSSSIASSAPLSAIAAPMVRLPTPYWWTRRSKLPAALPAIKVPFEIE